MKNLVSQVRRLFPGKNFYLLLMTIIALFLVSLLDLLGVATILPIIQIATGADYTTGYLGVIFRFMGEPSKNGMVLYSSLILVLAFVCKGIFSLLIKWWSGGFLVKQQTAASVTLLRSYANDSYINHRRRTTAEIMRSTLEATGQAYGAFIGGFLAVVGEGATIVMLMAMLLVIMPLQAFVALIYFGLASFLLQYFLKKRNREVGERGLATAWLSSDSMLNVVQGFRENRISGLTARRVYEFQEARLESVEAGRLGNFYQDLPKYLLEIIFIIGIALILALMILTEGIESAAYLIVFAGVCVRILPSFVRLVASVGIMRSGAPSVELLSQDLLALNNPPISFMEKEPEVAEAIQVFKETTPLNLTIENLSFKYPDSKDFVLENLNFKIPTGSSVAIVGGSGSGKTTLVDLILGLLQPTSGTVNCNGENVNLNPRKWQNYIGYVPQDVYLSGKTVQQEIAYGFKPQEIDKQRIRECIEIAELTDVIDGLDEGIDTVIGERGVRLSGGQRQRLGIARAIYRNPSVLVLDEATSALDNETEYKITQTIHKIAKEITVIIVAHRLSTVRDVDQLLFMSRGKIDSQGTFEEVRVKNPEFRKLVELGQLPE